MTAKEGFVKTKRHPENLGNATIIFKEYEGTHTAEAIAALDLADEIFKVCALCHACEGPEIYVPDNAKSIQVIAKANTPDGFNGKKAFCISNGQVAIYLGIDK